MRVWENLGVEEAEVTDYHRLARRELIDLFSSPRKRVVEIGCAAGYTGKYCKEKFPGVEYWGFELNKAAAKEALQHLDKVVCGKFEEQQMDLLGLAPHSVDGVVLGDVLEHMYDPWRALTALLPWLKADAELVVSIPNIRNLWLLNEIAEGRFTYDQHGLLDITHIRFFTGNELVQMVNSTGYSMAGVQLIMDERLADYYAASRGRSGPCVFHYHSVSIKSAGEKLAEFCAKQFLFRAVPNKNAIARIGNDHPDLLKSMVADHEASHEQHPHDYVDSLPAQFDIAAQDKPPRCPVYAFYLPQFHPTRENSEWWGEGFTEWANVSRAKPSFSGHYQPRHPGALGYYDLRVHEVMTRQIQLAKQAGLSGFVFYYYWFSGKRMLDMPMQQFMARYEEMKFPFLVMWCNENWKRTWLDGNPKGQDLLIGHEHLADDPERFIDDLAEVLRHPGYVRVDGKPVLLVYPLLGREGACSLEFAPEMIERWRNHARKLGIGELLIGALEWPRPLATGGFLSTQMLGVDFFFEFPPNQVWHYNPIRNHTNSYRYYQKDSQLLVAHYEDLVVRAGQMPPPPWPLVKTVIAGTWDNSPRKGSKAHVYHGATPALYKQWLGDSIRYAKQHPAVAGQPMVFVNAWNEWAEGAYLEPDKRYGYAYLAATQQALAEASANKAS